MKKNHFSLLGMFFLGIITIFTSIQATGQRTLTLGTSQTFHGATTSRAQISPIDAEHVLYLYKDGTSSTANDLVGRIGQVDTAAKTVTFGPEKIIEAGLYRYGTPLVLSSTKAVIAYEVDTTSDYGASRVIEFDLTGDSITTVGSKIQFDAGDIDAAFSHVPINMVKLTSTTFAILYADATDDGTVKIGTVSGTSITYGSAQVFSTGDVQNMSMTALDPTKILITYEDDGNSDVGKAIAGTISGNTVTYGSEATFSTPAVSYTGVAAISATQAAIAYIEDDINDYCYGKVATVSGTSITFSSSNYVIEDAQDGRDITMAYTQGNEFVVAYNGGTGDTSRVRVGEISGTGSSASIAFGSKVDFFSDEGDDSRVVAISDNAIVIAYVDDVTGDEGETVVGTMPGVSVPPTVSITVNNNVSCNGFSDGALTAVGSSGTTPYTYAWSTGASTASITGLVAGTYTVTLTDANSNTVTASTSISQPSAVVSSGSVTSALDCFGDTDAQVTASATGGTTPYTYSWNTGETNAIETNLGAGTYSVTVTDQNGCTDSASVVVTQPTALISSTTVTSALDCFGDTDAQVTASATGGTTPYTYSWNTGETNALETNLGAGTYSVTVTDQNGCTDSASVTLTQPTALLAATVVDSNASCAGNDGGTTASATGGTGSYTYSWSNGATTASITGIAAGTYSVTITDANGCTDSSSVSITATAAPSASITVDNTVLCNGGNEGGLTASATGGTGAYTYAWSTGATTASITNLLAGTYTITITDQTGCTDTESATLTNPSPLIVTTSVTTNVSCNGFADGGACANVSGGTPGYTYTWSNGSTIQCITGLAAGTYSVTVTDANGCTATATPVVITEPNVLIATAVVDSNTSCLGNDGGMTGSATGGTTPYTYAWSNGATTASITGVGAGTYSITITDANGCTDSASAVISQSGSPSASIAVNSNVSCNGGSDGALTASATGGAGSYTYSWSNGATSAAITGLVAGTYTVTVTDQSGCTDVTSASITEPTALVASISSSTNVSCNGGNNGSATGAGSGGTPLYSFLWSNGGNTATITGLSAGTYTVTVTDANGCTDSESVIISEPTAISLTTVVDMNVSCNGLSDGGASTTASGGTGSYTYAWSNGGTGSSITGVAAGTYTVTVTDANGCTETDLVTITEPTAIQISIMIDSLIACAGDSNGAVSVISSGGTSPYTYNWSNGATGSLVGNLVAGTYTVTVTDNNGCTNSDTVSLIEPAPLTGNIIGSTSITCNGLNNGSATATASGGTGTISYNWSSGSTDSTAFNLGVGSHFVTITDANGCGPVVDSIDISEPLPVILSIDTQSNVLCNGESNGRATILALGGVGGFNYAWPNGNTTATDTTLTIGNYTVTVTDANGCSNAITVNITQPAVLIVTTSATNANCEGGSDGEALATPSGGTPNYNYIWNDITNQMTNPATSLAEGTYTVTVTDANGCTAIDSTTVGFVNPKPTINLPDTGVLCIGFTYTIDAGSFTAYSWSTSDTTQSINVDAPGLYTVTVTDANGCTNEHTISIVIDACTGVKDITENVDVKCYPNPTKGLLNVMVTGTDQSLNIEVLNIQGQVIDSYQNIGFSSGNALQVDLSDEAQGIFFVRITSETRIWVQRVSLQ